MQRKSVLIAILLALAFLMSAAFVVAEEEMPEVVVINKAQSKKPPVTLNHEEHGEKFGCQVCHHNAKGDVKPQSCFNCHGKDPNIPDPSSMSATKNPFHIACRGCHKEKGEGPVKCTGCHKE